jgi:hypothetical protein
MLTHRVRVLLDKIQRHNQTLLRQLICVLLIFAFSSVSLSNRLVSSVAADGSSLGSIGG